MDKEKSNLCKVVCLLEINGYRVMKAEDTAAIYANHYPDEIIDLRVVPETYYEKKD
jgi:hypothetical protein